MSSVQHNLSFSRLFVTGWILAATLIFVAARWAAPESTVHRVDDPSKFQIIDFSGHSGTPISRHSDTGRQITDKLYGPYAEFIRDSTFPVSPETLAEYSIPVVRADGRILGVLEHPLLRIHLWQMKAPEFVIQGSSMMFMNFSRERFFQRYPGLHLLDYTMGDNIPPIAEYLLQQSLRRGLRLQPGMVFVYGLNDAELFDGYPPGITPDLSYYRHVFEVFEPRAAVVGDSAISFEESINRLIGAAHGRVALLRLLDRVLVAVRLREPYLLSVPASAVGNGAAIQIALLGRTLDVSTLLRSDVSPERTAWERVESIARISGLVKRSGGVFVVVRVPNSSLEFAKGIGPQLATNAGVAELEKRGITVIDGRDHRTVGIDDSHFVYPGGVFNPQHMNPDGAEIFTDFLLARLRQLGHLPPAR